MWLLVNNNVQGSDRCICLTELLNSTKTLNSESQFRGRDSNMVLFKRQSQIISLESTCSMNSV
jgi:hypothetical protein